MSEGDREPTGLGQWIGKLSTKLTQTSVSKRSRGTLQELTAYMGTATGWSPNPMKKEKVWNSLDPAAADTDPSKCW
jgi:hypothetical protein